MKKIVSLFLSLTSITIGSENTLQRTDDGLRIKTLNNMGVEHLGIDVFSQYYIDRCKDICEAILEIGSGYGHISSATLKNGAQNVYVNDLCLRHLEIFREGLSPVHNNCVHLIPGDFPEVTAHLNASQFHTIFASRVFHFGSPEKLEASRDEIYRLLKPGGQFILVAETPYLKKSYPDLIHEYERRKDRGEKHPGYFPDVKTRFPGLINYGPDTLHCLDPDALELLFSPTHFEIVRNEFINRLDYPDSLRLDGRESVGLIVTKK